MAIFWQRLRNIDGGRGKVLSFVRQGVRKSQRHRRWPERLYLHPPRVAAQ